MKIAGCSQCNQSGRLVTSVAAEPVLRFTQNKKIAGDVFSSTGPSKGREKA